MGEEHGQHEARLRLEFASRYPYLTPGVWEPAAVLTDRIVASLLGHPDGRFISRERAWNPNSSSSDAATPDHQPDRVGGTTPSCNRPCAGAMPWRALGWASRR